MAGVKVTDLTTLGTADANDIMYIVDTTANQSKQIQVQNIYDGLPQLDSGTFTPTISNITPSTTAITEQNGYYQRIDNIVSMSFFFELQFDPGDNDVTFEFSLPIASDFTSQKDLIGVVVPDTTTDWVLSYVQADVSSNNGVIRFQSSTSGSNYAYIRAYFQYEIK
jgi:hypothetical protein